ncbi:MAG: arginine--tRNA ligase [Bdellovibrionales bacterium]
MTDLSTQLSDIVGKEFAALGLDAALGAVKRSDRPDLGDFQCNGALAAAKQRGENPRALAEQIVAKLSVNKMFSKVDIAGPGFINLVLTPEVLSAQANTLAVDKRAGVVLPAKRKIMVEYIGLNMAKPMHVGHLRSTIIGDSIQRIVRFLGHDTVTDIHFGDWGLQIGLLLIALEDEQPSLPYFRADYNDTMNQPTSPVTMADLERMYPAAAARIKDDEVYRERARIATMELQKGRAGYLALHKHFWAVSRVSIERELGALGVHPDLWKGESDVNYLIDEIVADFTKRGIAVEDDGAIVVHVKRNTDKAEIPPLLLVSSADSAMYGTTDVATILERQREIKADLYIYVVDQRQALHFTQVFRTCVKAGYGTDEQFEHVGFGTMNGPDGKPFKTRAGGLISLHDLITTCREKARARMQEAGLEGDDETALMIGTAALKFADLSNQRMTNYIFDFDRFTSFEGKTGPYLQYQGVRIKSILRKAVDQNITDGPITLALPEERALALMLDAFNSAVHLAFEKRAPNFVADHVYNLAQAFSSFYAAAPILPEKDEAVRASRLRLAKTALNQLEIGLDLLGIKIPEKM